MNSISLLVLGMHRSGTSALTGVLAKLGAYPGPSLVPGMAEVNLKGFWEHPGIVEIHERLLESLHTSWHDVARLPPNWWHAPSTERFVSEIRELLERDYIDHSLWVVKDPRMCRLLPIWIPVLAEKNIATRYLIALRNPLEVAASLKKRDNLPVAHGCLLWLVYLMAAEQSTRGGMRVFIDYAALLNDWQNVVKRAAQILHLDLALDDAAAVADVNSFLDPSLKHQNEIQSDIDHPAVDCARKLYQQLNAGGAGNIEGLIDEYAPEVERLVDLVSPWSDAINLLHRAQAVANLQAQRARNYEQEVARVKASTSWRITAPLRVVQNGWRRFVDKSGRDV
jgi:hypothetical protein